ncbi:MAG: hypothetical protein PHV32_03150 [Eubacteriales bacterium]|nr:hypothetical protein [Eubacteriales bacterium]
MTYYHGTKVTGLFELVPINSPDTTLHKPTIYFTDSPVFAIFYIWNKPFKWMTYTFSDNGTPIYTEWFLNQLEYFYKSVSGVIYSTESSTIMPTHMQKVFISDTAVKVDEYRYIPDVYETILEFEKANQIIIKRYETLTEAELQQIEKQIISAIHKEKLLSRDIPKTDFVKMMFPVAWEKSKEENGEY